jgi:hypothetical protein
MSTVLVLPLNAIPPQVLPESPPSSAAPTMIAHGPQGIIVIVIVIDLWL